MDKTINQKAWFLVLPVVPGRRLLRGVLPLMTVVNYSMQDTFGNKPVLLERRRLVQGIARSLDRSRRPLPRLARAQSVLLAGDPRHRSPRSASSSRCRCRATAGLSRPAS